MCMPSAENQNPQWSSLFIDPLPIIHKYIWLIFGNLVLVLYLFFFSVKTICHIRLWLHWLFALPSKQCKTVQYLCWAVWTHRLICLLSVYPKLQLEGKMLCFDNTTWPVLNSKICIPAESKLHCRFNIKIVKRDMEYWNTLSEKCQINNWGLRKKKNLCIVCRLHE